MTDSVRGSDMGERHSWNINSIFSKSIIKEKLETIAKISYDSQPAGLGQAA